MQKNNLKRFVKDIKPKQVGRGGKRGKTSGRGTKGQKARAGRKIRPELRDIIKKIPKLRGLGAGINTSIQIPFSVVNLSAIEKNFQDGQIVSPRILFKKGLVRKIGGKFPKVKILGDGILSKKFIFENCKVSLPAKEKIIEKGGEIKVKND